MTKADQTEIERRIDAAKVRRNNCDDPVYQDRQDAMIEQLEGKLALEALISEVPIAGPIMEIPIVENGNDGLAMDVKG